MNKDIILVKDFYSSGNIKNLLLSIIGGNEINLPISDINLNKDEPYKFKLIIERIKQDSLILDTETLGEKIEEILYTDILISQGSKIIYTHNNEGIFSSDVQKVIENNVAYSTLYNNLEGKYNIKIGVFKKSPVLPQLISEEAPQVLTDYEQKIPIITVYILFFKADYEINKNLKITNASIFGSFGHLGFFMTNLRIFKNFIEKEIGNKSVNLVELFTSTDLVDKCLEAGILIITWGITPWHYYVCNENSFNYLEDDEIVSGIYKIREDIQELSVIPGDELLYWPSCLKKSWPKIQLQGKGERIDLSLHVKEGDLGNELVLTYVLKRSSKNFVISPIINYDFLEKINL